MTYSVGHRRSSLPLAARSRGLAARPPRYRLSGRSGRSSRISGRFVHEFCKIPVGFLGRRVHPLLRELWHLAVVICTPYTSAADFSADASHLSGGGGIVTPQHVAVTIRLPSWVVPSSSSSTPNVMSTNSFSSPPSREYFGFSRHHTTSGLFRVPQAHRPM